MQHTLKQKAQIGIFWSAIDAFAAQAVSFTVGIILARLLLPAEFGLIGMLSIFMAVAQSFLGSGFGSALIQKKEISSIDSSSVFYFNLVVGFALAFILYLFAPSIASFYRQPVLSALIRAMSLVMIIGSFGIVQSAILTRNMNFKAQTKITLTASILSGAIGITMAYRGLGVWSLVGQQISAAFFRSVALWLFNTWRPLWAFSFKSLRQMFAFGSRILASGILNEIFDNIYYMIIGKVFTPEALGFYSRARRLQELPSHTLSNVVGRVSFPIFSSIQNDKVALKEGLSKALRLLVFINTPIMVGLAVIAERLVVLLLTEKWLPCVPYLQLLSAVGILFPLQLLNLNALLAMGRSDLFLRLEIIKKVLIVANIALTWHIGIFAMILGQIAVSIACYFINSYYTGKILNYPALKQLRDVSPFLAFSGSIGFMLYLLKYVPVLSGTFLIAAQVATGVSLYLLLSVKFQRSQVMTLWQSLAANFNKKSK